MIMHKICQKSIETPQKSKPSNVSLASGHVPFTTSKQHALIYKSTHGHPAKGKTDISKVSCSTVRQCNTELCIR